MKNVIVTGATGLIGCHLTNILLQQGVNVTAIVRPMSEKMDNLTNLTLMNNNTYQVSGVEDVEKPGKLTIIECNLSDLPSLRDKLGWEQDVFFHFGWGHTFGPGRNDASKQESNIKATLDAVHLAYEAGCKTFVGAGSQAEFGIVSGTLSDELPKDPTTGYGIAKLAANRLSALECKNLGMRHVWGRVLSCYGPGDNDLTMVMSAIRTMLASERMQFTPAEQVWDYIFGEDCANAFLAMAEKGVDQKCYTIGSGKERLLREFIYDIRDAIDPGLDVGIGERDYNENQVMHLVADITDLVADTGYTPSTSFRDGIEHTIAWVKNK